MIRAVLFDLDDTLFDHRRSARAALEAVHRTFAAGVDFDAFERHHVTYLEVMHVEVLAGRVSMDDARRERFRRVFSALGLELSPGDVHRAAAAYRDGYVVSRQPMAGAAALLAHLHARVRIGIVTNNLLEEQREKLEVCGFAPHVDTLVASEDVGVSKPDAGIFRIALDRLDVAAGESVMVGDSWANDIEGAAAAGIPVVWFNPLRLAPPAAAASVRQIAALEPAHDIAALILGTD